MSEKKIRLPPSVVMHIQEQMVDLCPRLNPYDAGRLINNPRFKKALSKAYLDKKRGIWDFSSREEELRSLIMEMSKIHFDETEQTPYERLRVVVSQLQIENGILKKENEVLQRKLEKDE